MPLYHLLVCFVSCCCEHCTVVFAKRLCVICFIRRPFIKLGPAVKCTKTLCMLHMQSIVGCYHIAVTAFCDAQ